MCSRYVERITHSRDCNRFGAFGVESLGTSSKARTVCAAWA